MITDPAQGWTIMSWKQALRSLRAIAFAVTLMIVHAVPLLAQPVADQSAGTPSPQVTSAQQETPTALDSSSPAATSGARALKDTTSVPHDMSPWSMFSDADMVVQAIMIGLAFASLVTWTVGIAKMLELSISARRLRDALKSISESRSLAEAQLALGRKDTVLSPLLAAAIREGRMSAGLASDAGIKERAASSFSEIIRSEARRVRFGMGALATIGATSPFVGLFGTVWGIMNSFIGISKSQTTNLAVVAPGIAEALLATAIGLVAAIPAVILYNHFSRVTKGYLEHVSRASGAVGRLLSRDLDRPHVAHANAAE